MSMSKYDMLMCVDMYKATKKVHTYSSSSYTFCRLIAKAIRANFVILESLHAPMLDSPMRSLV